MATQLERLASYIQSDELTDEQRAICKEPGSFVVRACPGSGKTRTVGTRLAWRMANWQSRRSGIAALSFTNVAWQEIGRYLHDALGCPSTAPHPHFLGTIDSFVNRFLLAPFGHIFMACGRRPEVVHPQSPLYSFVQNLRNPRDRRLWYCIKKNCSPTSLSYSSEGQVERQELGYRANCKLDRCREMKLIMEKAGYALPSDAMYWGMKVVREVAGIAETLARRFPEIIIDEAQDTTETQFQILQTLSRAGSNIVMVGDPDQAIFEFSGGRPDRFMQFEEEAEKKLHLSVNFRSSQKICDATSVFRDAISNPSKAGGPDRDFQAKAQLLAYDPKIPTVLLNRYVELLEPHSIPSQDAVILTRRHSLVARLSAVTQHGWPTEATILCRTLAQAATMRDSADTGRSHRNAMGALSQIVYGETKSTSVLLQ